VRRFLRASASPGKGTDAIPWGVWHDIYLALEARALTLDYWKKELYDRIVIRCRNGPCSERAIDLAVLR
jgi:hypothetical protein